MNDEIKTNESYRRILATAHKLETIQSNLESIIDFFLVPIVKLYSKLSNDCFKLLFECDFKLDYFRKTEELLWRRIYYDIYRFQKAKKQKITRQDELLIESHFVSGIGFYSTLIVKLRSHYNIHNVRGLILPFDLSLGPIDNFVEDTRLNDDLCNSVSSIDTSSTSADGNNNSAQNPAKDWARLAIYRSLVYMGDLARYLLETSQNDYRKLAYDFYLSASRNQPDYGLPFNQLATLAGNQNYNLDAVCNYMRCCLRPKPFERAEGNMRNLFELNKKIHDEFRDRKTVVSVAEVFSSKEPSLAAELVVRVVIVNFIKLTSDLWSAIVDDSMDVSVMKLIAEETRTFFEGLREALELEPIVPLAHQSAQIQEFEPISDGSASTEKLRHITPTVMYHFCSVSVMLIAKLQQKPTSKQEGAKSENSALADLVHALALNLLYYSTSKCQKMIVMKLQELRVNQNCADKAYVSDKPSAWIRRSDENVGSSSHATGRKTLSRLRQREAASTYSDRTKPIVVQHDDSDMSELEETALSTIDALEISSDMSEEADRHVSDLIDLASNSSDERSSVATTALYVHPLRNLSNISDLSKPVLRPTRSQNYESPSRPTSHLYSSCNSLPVSDLVTGDISERFGQRLINSNNGSINYINNREPKERCSPGSSSDGTETSQSIREIDRAYSFVYRFTYVPTIKVLCDWLLSNGHIIGLNLSSFHAFCTELERLVSLLEDMRKVALTKDSSHTTTVSNAELLNNSISIVDDENLLYKHLFEGPTWRQRYPLSCDFPLFNLEPIRIAHKMNIDFNIRKVLNCSESGFISVECLRAFCHTLKISLDDKDSD